MNAPFATNADELAKRIEDSLDSIRPYLEADGGNVRVVEITHDFIVRLEFVGNCGTCPMSTMTFKAGIEEAIRRSVPNVKAIEVLNVPIVN